jgi:hypothetical protein
MAQNIADFYRAVQKNDFARQFQFRVVQLANTNFNEEQFVYLETATLPGRAINNVQVPFMGLNFNVPGTATYPGSESYQVTFRCDQNYNIRAVLENATFNTFDDGTSTGDYNIARNSSVITLNLLGKNGSTIRQYTLYGAYVVSLDANQYSLGDAGAIVTIPTTLAYQYWRVTSSTTQDVPTNTEIVGPLGA